MSETLALDPIVRLTRDLKQAAVTLSPNEARYLVDAYYQIQEYRKAAGNQHRALAEAAEPHEVIAWLFTQTETLEAQIKRALDAWTDSQEVSQWAKGIVGIGPVIAAGLLAHIDLTRCTTAGYIWRFAGLDPSMQWLGTEKAAKLVKDKVALHGSVEEALPAVATAIGTRPDTLLRLASTDHKSGRAVAMTQARLARAAAKRPWNANLKTLCWKIGESFVKVSGNSKDFYGKLYLQRKANEVEANEDGKYSEQAKLKLERFNIGKGTEARKWYEQGKLPPAHLHARAKRWTVKLFLSHYHEVGRRVAGLEVPKPFAIAHQGHADYIAPPNFD